MVRLATTVSNNPITALLLVTIAKYPNQTLVEIAEITKLTHGSVFKNLDGQKLQDHVIKEKRTDGKKGYLYKLNYNKIIEDYYTTLTKILVNNNVKLAKKVTLKEINNKAIHKLFEKILLNIDSEILNYKTKVTMEKIYITIAKSFMIIINRDDLIITPELSKFIEFSTIIRYQDYPLNEFIIGAIDEYL